MTKPRNLRTFERLMSQQTNDCILWPHGVDSKGYGKIKYGSKLIGTHRLALILGVGQPPFPDAQAAHSCRSRNCMNPRHLRWASSYENNEDRWRQGTNVVGEEVGSAKLTDEAVILIRSLEHRNTRSGVFAEKYGVTVTTISNARYGRTWRHVPMPMPVAEPLELLS